MGCLKYYLRIGIILVLVVFSVTAQAAGLSVSLTDFPSRAQTFIKLHFADQTIKVLNKEEGIFQTKYQVMFGSKLELTFDGEGNWLRVDGVGRRIPVGFVPGKILTYIQSRYPNMDVTSILRRSNQIEVKINDDVELIFDITGNFLK